MHNSRQCCCSCCFLYVNAGTFITVNIVSDDQTALVLQTKALCSLLSGGLQSAPHLHT